MSNFSVYMIRNKINNKMYIGQTKFKSEHRWMGHIRDAKFRKNGPFYNSIRKYGPDNFEVLTLENCNSRSEADLSEIKFITILRTRDRNIGYNISFGGYATRGMLGKKHNKNTRKQISDSKIGSHHTEKTKSKMSKTHSTIEGRLLQSEKGMKGAIARWGYDKIKKSIEGN